MISRAVIVERMKNEEHVFRNLELGGIDLRGLDLEYAEFRGCKMRGADLSEANLWRANFSDSDLQGAKFVHAYMYDTKLYRVDLTEADFTGAFLQAAELVDAYLWGTNFLNADLRNAGMSGAAFGKEAVANARHSDDERNPLNELKFDPGLRSPFMSNTLARNILLPRRDYDRLVDSLTGLEALFHLLSQGDGSYAAQSALLRWHFEGVMNKADPSDVRVVNYYAVCDAFSYYAQNYLVGLDLLTNEVIDGSSSVPVAVHDSYLKIFQMMDPKAMPVGAKERLDRILDSSIGRSVFAGRFRDFRRQLRR